MAARENYDLNRLRQEFRNFGFFLACAGASIVFRAILQPSSNNGHVFMGFALLMSSIMLVMSSFVVSRFPGTAALVIAMVKHAVLIMGAWLIRMY